eukprot:s4419_g2.t1
MSGAKLSKSELQKRLQALGETPPAAWTKVQLASRLAELSEETETILSERDAAKMVNKCKTKVALQELLTEHSVYFTKHQNSDQLKSSMLKYLMENKVPATEDNYMGFGKHSHLTYGETLVMMTAYTEWCVTTAVEEPECHWRLKRYVRWVQSLGDSEKRQIQKRTQIGQRRPLQSPPRHGYSTTHSASSGMTNEHRWEMVSDMEMVPAESSEQAARIRELETEMKQLKEMIANNNQNPTEDSTSVHKKQNRTSET